MNMVAHAAQTMIRWLTKAGEGAGIAQMAHLLDFMDITASHVCQVLNLSIPAKMSMAASRVQWTHSKPRKEMQSVCPVTLKSTQMAPSVIIYAFHKTSLHTALNP